MTQPAPPTLRTERLVLEMLTVGHAAEMVDVLADPALYAFTGGEPPTVEELRERYRRQAAGSPDPATRWCNWVVRLRAGERPATGYVQATVSPAAPDGPVAEVAWVTGAPWQGRGIAREAAAALVDWLTDQGVRTVVAHIHPGHHASAAVATAAGLTATGRVEDGEVRWERGLSPARAPGGARSS
jgi:RimJ/RimL family protein N-acetyltransferase